ncbi:MAG: hypothetical protein H0T46_12030 [Deltaproteobacteria bacterium]|nr:hypothetical protein [Deltaproteobacteria bacterium]
MKRLACLLALSVATPAAADAIGAEPADHGSVTHIRKGVKEIDLGGIFVLSHDKAGDGEGTTQISSLGGLSFQYFISDNFSAGAMVLASYERVSATTHSSGFGGMAFGSLHVRLGLGAFLRPTLGAGMIVGSTSTEITPGMQVVSSRIAGLVRLALPFAYFPSRRIVLQAGPELDVEVGSVTPDGGEGQSFTSVTGGFGVSAGYVF